MAQHFWILSVLLADDLAKVLATLQQGIASDEHSAFVERLRLSGSR